MYDFVEIPQALMLNPGMETGYDWYAGIPGLSGIYAQGATSGLSVDDIFADDGLDINDKVRNRAVFGLGIRDNQSLTGQIEVLSGGFRSRKRPQDFYSFGIYGESDWINYWPRDLAILAYEGNADRIGERFDLSHLKTRGDVLSVFHFGVNRQLNRQLTAGVRAKLYSSILNYTSTSNDGYFLTRQGQNNLLTNILVADMRLRSSGLRALENAADEDVSEVTSTILGRGLLGGDLGLGLDFGFTYKLNPQTVITASILDLGFIYHFSDVDNFSLQGRAANEGVEIILPDALDDPGADFWQELVDEIEALIPFGEDTRSYVTFRPTKLYGSIKYSWGMPRSSFAQDCDCDVTATARANRNIYRNSVGGQLFVVNRPRGPQAALTAFYDRRLGNFLALRSTYTLDKYSMTNFGLGLSLQAGPVNFYILADNLLAYQNLAAAHTASFQFGLNILSWGDN
ncbi:DUF5723 family protein [Lentiprolixibacter aurantiacus]|uniref:DUF5723 family protein n=1 Tax=Lentiprolixibacter aurantiacus TaxID=2993939 RepID=A0AAE3MPN7_9FLAO|nr:DUF5723 family protein [Lentiprolixibacter aurantiacus]MCX2720699.1 DUF5723 family protein [Lentiprolixibacter aurantiacus]